MNAFSRWHHPEPRWYLGVCCNRCQSPILFALDHTDEAEDRPQPTTAKLVLTCTREGCGHKADYTAAAVLRLLRLPVETPGRMGTETPKKPPSRTIRVQKES